MLCRGWADGRAVNMCAAGSGRRAGKEAKNLLIIEFTGQTLEHLPREFIRTTGNNS
jgi:hypothetical protein